MVVGRDRPSAFTGGAACRHGGNANVLGSSAQCSATDDPPASVVAERLTMLAVRTADVSDPDEAFTDEAAFSQADRSGGIYGGPLQVPS